MFAPMEDWDMSGFASHGATAGRGKLDSRRRLYEYPTANQYTHPANLASRQAQVIGNVDSALVNRDKPIVR